MGNSAVFSPPDKASYKTSHPNLIWMPRCPSSPLNQEIPCMFLPHSEPTDRIILYFHCNSVDIGKVAKQYKMAAEELESHILVIEYPNYGLYKGRSCDESNIYQDALDIYDFLVHVLDLGPDQILVFGRSIGSGPSTYLARHRNIGALILFAPF